ncbi:hypothetical protein C5167_010826 [Papaver somniferum]|uniref:Uncharacterized protein n=1 Tax=Papaver somniferum TaxID=3469 RepID=A0A4Y7K4L3_PAPSO|nr:hypothetical protein C5167_010826 [Papaver somniferum]
MVVKTVKLIRVMMILVLKKMKFKFKMMVIMKDCQNNYAINVDVTDMMGTLDVIRDLKSYLKSEFEMKNLWKARPNTELSVYYSTSLHMYKVVRKFNKDMHPDSIPMVSRGSNASKRPFRIKEDDEDVLGDEISISKYNSIIMYSIKVCILMELFS